MNSESLIPVPNENGLAQVPATVALGEGVGDADGFGDAGGVGVDSS